MSSITNNFFRPIENVCDEEMTVYLVSIAILVSVAIYFMWKRNQSNNVNNQAVNYPAQQAGLSVTVDIDELLRVNHLSHVNRNNRLNQAVNNVLPRDNSVYVDLSNYLVNNDVVPVNNQNVVQVPRPIPIVAANVFEYVKPEVKAYNVPVNNVVLSDIVLNKSYYEIKLNEDPLFDGRIVYFNQEIDIKIASMETDVNDENMEKSFDNFTKPHAVICNACIEKEINSKVILTKPEIQVKSRMNVNTNVRKVNELVAYNVDKYELSGYFSARKVYNNRVEVEMPSHEFVQGG